jgi:branched-chain amino acid transport system substrate-binding protein
MGRGRRSAVLVGCVALVAAACGGDDSGEDGAGEAATGEASATTAEAASTTAAATSDGTTTTAVVEQPTSMEEWEALWAEERAAIVKRITDNGWGKSADGKTLTGPEGFTIDLSQCPAGWSDTEGLTDTEIRIGQTLPQSGPAADYGNLGKGMSALFDDYSEKGAFKDSEGKTRKINYIVKDDGYDPARTIPLVDELVDAERVFSVSTLGSPGTMKTYDKLNERCVPQPFAQTGHPAWGDPVNHPWTTGFGLAYNTEAVLWGGFIDQHFEELSPDGEKITVASLVSNNDFGISYDEGFRAYLQESENKDKIEYVSEKIEPTAPTVTDPMTTLASKDPDVFISMVFSSFCTQVITAAAENGLQETAQYLFVGQVCPGTTYVKKEAVGGDGAASDKWWQVNPGLKELNDPNQFSDPYIAYVRGLLEADGVDPATSSTIGSGVNFAWPYIQSLIIAGELEGGLTRSNFALAYRSLQMTNPYALPGINASVDGNKDAYYTEAAAFQRWDVPSQAWVVEGGIVDLGGRSKNCAWDQGAAVCR